MKNHNASKFLALGIVIGAALVTAIAAKLPGEPTVGRFQLGTDQTRAVIIDTTTGQVWNANDTEFAQPKLAKSRLIKLDSDR